MATQKKNENEEVSVKTERVYHWFEPIDREHTDPVWVCINGKGTLIQRGVDVEVSKEVYEVLLNRRKMQALAFERSMALQDPKGM